jgi:hypothetical protein
MFCDMVSGKIGDGPNDHSLHCYAWCSIPFTEQESSLISRAAVSILIMIQASTSAVFFGVDTMLLYLCMELGFTLIYTILVTSRLLVMRCQMKQAVAQYNSSTYDTVVLMLIESAALYSVICVILIVSIVSDCDGLSNLFYLSITNVQVSRQSLCL